jgi:hypothetical protein
VAGDPLTAGQEDADGSARDAAILAAALPGDDDLDGLAEFAAEVPLDDQA